MMEAMTLCSMALAATLECFSSLFLPDGWAYPTSAMLLLVCFCAECKECVSELVMIQTHHRHDDHEEKKKNSLIKMEYRKGGRRLRREIEN